MHEQEVERGRRGRTTDANHPQILPESAGHLQSHYLRQNRSHYFTSTSVCCHGNGRVPRVSARVYYWRVCVAIDVFVLKTFCRAESLSDSRPQWGLFYETLLIKLMRLLLVSGLQPSLCRGSLR